ncbi:MAG: PAS domain S-box protein [Ardenticatenaceae bacterium]|nr:PAS domain S-box protein [Ardenticatenaceae bacterium]MCB9005129.1 PAS domain S-box protein [Ardenticatenaceae bacterium]
MYDILTFSSTSAYVLWGITTSIGLLCLGSLLLLLRRSRQRPSVQTESDFYRLFNASPVAMAVSNIGDGRLLNVNTAFQELTGYTREEALGKTVIELQLWVNPDEFAVVREQIASHHMIHDVKFHFRRQSGDTGIGLISSEEIGVNGSRVLITAVHDITEQQQAEEALLRRAQEMTALYLTSVELAETLQPDEALPVIASQAAHLFGLEKALLYLLQDNNQVLELTAAYNLPPELIGTTLPVTDNTIGQFIQSGQAVICNGNIDPAKTLPPYVGSVQCVMGAPLRQQEQVIGFLLLLDSQAQNIGENDLQLLELFAAFAALALEKAQLFAQEQNRGAELEALHTISRDLIALQDLDLLLKKITERAAQLLQRPSGGVSIYRSDLDALEWTVEIGDTIAPIGMILQRDEGLHGTVLTTKQPLIINNYTEWQEKSPQQTDLAASVVGVPIQWGETFLGVLCVVDPSQHPFAEWDAHLLSQFATQAAIAIENSRLYKQAQLEITERGRVENALRKSEEQFRTIVDSINDALFVHNVETGTIVDVNQRACELYGYSRQDLQQQQVQNLSSGKWPYDQEEMMARFRLTAVHGPQIFEWLARNKSNRLFWVEINVRLARIADQERFLVTIRDINDRKRAEAALKDYAERLEDMVTARTAELTERTQQLEEQTQALAQAKEAADAARDEAERQREKAEIANRAKTTFLANMSHELRTPLNSILGYAQILARDESLTKARRQELATIRDSGQHLLTLINDILDLSKIETSHMELHPTAVFLPQFLQEIADIIRMRAKQKRVNFHYSPPANLPSTIQVDEKRLRQILINLLDNGVKFTDGGGITFTVEHLEQESSTDTDHVTLRFTVADTGVGMSDKELHHIFTPFTQVGDLQRRNEGTGLGLAITHKLIQMMGSILHVLSTPGVGSTFWFDLRLLRIEISHPRVVMRQIVGYIGRKRVILIIDDNRINLRVLRALLETVGFSIITANGGAEGIVAAQQHHPDAVLLDLIMPGMDGFETAVAMRQIPELTNTVIIAVSASAFPQDIERSKQAGCNDFLPKPVQAKQVYATIGKWLQLSWLYENNDEEAKKISSIDNIPVSLPPEALKELLDLALSGNMRGIQEKAAQLAQSNATYKPVTDRLIALAQGYEEREVLALIEQQLP